MRYDVVCRSREETKRDPGQAVLYSVLYGYDMVGNRTSMTRDTVGYTYIYDDNDKLTSVSGGGQSASFSYDLDGNTTGVSGDLFGSWSLTYDEEDRLTSVIYPGDAGPVTDYYYWNALGQRMRSRLNGSNRRFVYNGERMLEETTLNGDLLVQFTAAGDSYYAPFLHMWRSAATHRFPAYDLTGSVRGLVNSTSQLTDTYTLDAFGRQVGATGTCANPYRFGGEWAYYRDPSGLLQLGARFYWPEIGRFLQQDPAGEGMNWYAYVGNNPVTWVDPTGERVYAPWDPRSTWYHVFTNDEGAWSEADEGLMAGIDGFIPFVDPFERFYDPCDPALQGSRMMGGFTRDVMISVVGAPELPTWLRNPRLYEIGQRALPDGVYAKVAELSPIERGARLLETYGSAAKIPRPGIRTYGKLILTGFTPPGYPVVAAGFHGADYWVSGQW